MHGRRVLTDMTLIVWTLTLAACSTSSPNATSSLNTTSLNTTSSINQTQRSANDAGTDVDCKPLTGLMQVRILEARSAANTATPSGLSQIFQSSLGNLFGASAKKPATAQAAADRAQLEADNKRLVAAGCRSFDLERDLTQTDAKLTPTPTIAAATVAAPTVAGPTVSGPTVAASK